MVLGWGPFLVACCECERPKKFKDMRCVCVYMCVCRWAMMDGWQSAVAWWRSWRSLLSVWPLLITDDHQTQFSFLCYYGLWLTSLVNRGQGWGRLPLSIWPRGTLGDWTETGQSGASTWQQGGRWWKELGLTTAHVVVAPRNFCLHCSKDVLHTGFPFFSDILADRSSKNFGKNAWNDLDFQHYDRPI